MRISEQEISNISILIAWVVVLSVLAVAKFRKHRRVYIPDFTCGLRFVNGAYANVLGPGGHRYPGFKENVEVVDMRPQPVWLDRTFYRDVWNTDAFVSLLGEMLISDPHLATTALKDQINDSLPIVRTAIRSTLSRGIAGEDPGFRLKTAADITQAVNAELSKVGMRIQNVEVVEFWVRPVSGEVKGVPQ